MSEENVEIVRRAYLNPAALTDAAPIAPDAAGTLRVSESASGVGVVEPVNDPESPDRLRGGAEDLPGTLNPLGG